MARSAPASAPLDLGRAFRFVIDDPEWVKKIIIGGLFALLSVILVGAPFVAGYFVRLLRNVARGEARPMPEWDDLGGLFTDGIRALAVYLGHLLAVMIVPASIGCLVGLVMGGASHAGRGPGAEALEVVAGLGMLGLYVVFGLFMLVLMLYVPAALLRFALYDRVAAGFQPREVLEIIRRNIGSYLLALVL